MKMKLLVGLGNPGEKYAQTRHNIGFMMVDFLCSQYPKGSMKMSSQFKAEVCEVSSDDGKIIMVKPQQYMNRSGEATQKLAQFYKIPPQDIIVVHDDLDIHLGEYKVQKGKGPKIHNGILSIEEHLHTKDFMRVRIGVDNRNPENRIPGEDYVLSKFLPEEKTLLEDTFKKIQQELEL